MKKSEYFLRAVNAGCARHVGWVLDAFAYHEPKEGKPNEPYAWPLWRDKDGYKFFNEDTQEVEVLEDTNDTKPAFRFAEPIDLKAGDVVNLDHACKTSYGNVFYNDVTVVYAVGKKIPFQEGEVFPAKVQKIFYGMLTTPEEGAVRDPEAIYVDEYLAFQEGIHYTENFATISVPSATRRNVVTDPRIPAIRKKLLEDNAANLHDPAVESKIVGELVKVDKEWIDGDPDKGFYTKEKSFNVTRKKMFLIQGTEQGFNESPQANIIANSLEDGWEIDRLPDSINSLRNGSFSRGAMTAQGGEIVKILLRMTQNTSISEPDCGDTVGFPVSITKDNHLKYVDRYFIDGKGVTYIDATVAPTLIGKDIKLRSPWACKTAGYNYCVHCMGKGLAETPKAIGVYVSDVGSSLLLMFLSLMHGRISRTAKYDIKNRIG